MTNETIDAIPTQFKHVVAFEVSKAKLHVHILPGGETFEIANERASVQRVIRKEQRRNPKLGIGPLLVVCEATGTYSNVVVEAACEAGVACHRAHGSRVRAFARFRGTLAKSDPIDVPLIADYAASSRNLVLHRSPSPAQLELRELVGRRTELREQKEAEEARLAHVSSKVVTASIKLMIRTLEKEIEKCEARIGALVEADETFRRTSALMRSVKGVGLITSAAILAYLPEIGTVSRQTIAALIGLAPFDADSGEQKGKRHIRGGRPEARKSLYMAALVALQTNEHLKAFAGRIKAKGRPFKVQVTAVMRKLIVILNAVVQTGEPCRMASAAKATQ